MAIGGFSSFDDTFDRSARQLGQAMRPDELRDLVDWSAEQTGIDRWMTEAMHRHYELIALPGICEAVSRRDWAAIDIIAERWDWT